jgi:DNA-binding NarL/FixJ family response regulator
MLLLCFRKKISPIPSKAGAVRIVLPLRQKSNEETMMHRELNDREREIARLAAAGMTNPEIAKQLHMSLGNVKYHLGRVFEKLGVRRRAELGLLLQEHEKNEPNRLAGAG